MASFKNYFSIRTPSVIGFGQIYGLVGVNYTDNNEHSMEARLMPPKTQKKTNPPWTEEKDEKLRNLFLSSVPFDDICEQFFDYRKENVEQRLMDLGLLRTTYINGERKLYRFPWKPGTPIPQDVLETRKARCSNSAKKLSA